MKTTKQQNAFRFPLLLCAIFIGAVSIRSYAGETEGGTSPGGGDAVNHSGDWSLLDLGEKLPYQFFTPFKTMGSIIHSPYPSRVAEHAAGFYGKALSVMEHKCAAKMEVEYLNSENKPYTNITEIISSAGIINFLYSGNETFIFPDVIAEFPVGSSESYPSLKSRLSKDAMENMSTWIAPQLVWMKTQTPLENIPDEGIVRLQDDDTKAQLAAQKDGYVMVYEPIFQELDAKNRAALVLHESLLRVLLKFNPEHYRLHGTEKVRELVRLLLDENAESIGKPAFDQLCGHQGIILKDLKFSLVKKDN